jgi:hypothetical protein
MKRYTDEEIMYDAPEILAKEVSDHIGLLEDWTAGDLRHAAECVSAASDIPAKNFTAALFAMRFLAQEKDENSAELRERADYQTRLLLARLHRLTDAMIDPSLTDEQFGALVTENTDWSMDSTNHSVGRAMRGLFRYVGSILVGDDTDFAACVDVVNGLMVAPDETGEIPNNRRED